MRKERISIRKIIPVLVFIELLSAGITAMPCRGADNVSVPTITLNVTNETLKNVLGEISRTTRWKIRAPERWMDKPVTQTLKQASLEEGLRSILKNAGIENLLLMYDEGLKIVMIYDTDGIQEQSAKRLAGPHTVQTPAASPYSPPAQLDARPPSAPVTSDPILSRPAGDTRPGRSRSIRRGGRRDFSEE